MQNDYPLDKMAGTISLIKKSALELKDLSSEFEAVSCNIDRILASVRMLEINVSDVADLTAKDRTS
jgi:hypothetical protein